jgi:hypothetical protein
VTDLLQFIEADAQAAVAQFVTPQYDGEAA